MAERPGAWSHTSPDEKVPEMFAHHCTACDKRLLIFPSQVRALTNTADGIVVEFTCWCGAEQTWVTGRRRPARVPTPAAA